MKLSLKLILLQESARSDNMAKAIAALAQEKNKAITPSKVLPLVLGNLLKLKKKGWEAEDRKFQKDIDSDIDKLTGLMILLGISRPKASI